MDASPGNPDMSNKKMEEHTASGKTPSAAGEASGRERTSGKESPRKNGGIL